MKKIIRILTLMALINLTSCIDNRKELCNFNGGIIMEKNRFTFDCFYDIKYDGSIHHVEAFEIDFNYNVGDTISAPCLQSK